MTKLITSRKWYSFSLCYDFHCLIFLFVFLVESSLVYYAKFTLSIVGRSKVGQSITVQCFGTKFCMLRSLLYVDPSTHDHQIRRFALFLLPFNQRHIITVIYLAEIDLLNSIIKSNSKDSSFLCAFLRFFYYLQLKKVFNLKTLL